MPAPRAAVQLWALILITPLLLAGPGAAGAAGWPEPQAAYSALRTITGGGFQASGRVNHDHGKERFEMQQQGMPVVSIRRPDLKKAWMIMPAMNMAMELDLKQAGMVPTPETYAGDAPEQLGRETVAGEATTRYRSVSQQAQGTYTVDIWVTDDGIPLLMRGTGPQGDFEMALSELQRGPQDPALFELPAGAQLMPANPAMMQGMPGAMPGAQ